MFYVSSVSMPTKAFRLNDTIYDKIGISVTETGETQFYSNSQVNDLLSQVKVYGAYSYGYDRYHKHAYCTPLKVNQSMSVLKLKEVLDNFKVHHNPWGKYALADYLATLKVGTTIGIDYKDVASDGRTPIIWLIMVSRIDDDLWYVRDNNSALDGRDVNSSTLADVLDYPWCGTRSHKLSAR